MGHRVLPQRKRAPLQATHKVFLVTLVTTRFSPYFISEPFRMPFNHKLDESFSAPFEENFNFIIIDLFKTCS